MSDPNGQEANPKQHDRVLGIDASREVARQKKQAGGNVIKFIFLLGLAIALPIAVLEVNYRLNPKEEDRPQAAQKRTESAVRASSPGATDAVREEPAFVETRTPSDPPPSEEESSAAVVPPAQGSDTTTTSNVPQRKRGQYAFAGELSGNSGTDRVELRLKTPRGETSRFTNRDGEFSFAVRPEQFPLELTLDGQVLYRRLEPPGTESVQVTAGPVRTASFHQGLIRPRALSTEIDANGRCIVEVYGTTLLPAGSEIIMRMKTRSKETVRESLHELIGDGVLSRLEGSTDDLYFGDYIVQLCWRPAADPKAVAQLRDVLPQPLPPGELPANLVIRMFLGARAAAAAQERLIQEFYEDAVEACSEARDIVLLLGKKARKERFNKRDLKGLLRKKDHLKAAKSLATNRKFPVKTWRRLLDEEFPLWWQLYSRQDAPFPMKYPGRLAQLDLAFDTLDQLAKLESQRIYKHFRQSMDPRDYVDPEFGLETLHDYTLKNLNIHLRGLEKEL